MRKKIAAGSVLQRSYRDRKGRVRKTSTCFLRYYVDGKQIFVPAGTENREEAITLLRQKMAKVARRAEYSDQVERVLVDQLLDLVIEDYQYERRSSTYDAEHRIDKHLRPFFGGRKASEITTSLIKRYVASRLHDAEPATVNKELSYLRRAFHLGYRNEPQLVEKVPYFRMLPIDNARSGTVSHEQYWMIRDSLPSYARIALVIAYHTGARKGEIRKIRLDRIEADRAAGQGHEEQDRPSSANLWRYESGNRDGRCGCGFQMSISDSARWKAGFRLGEIMEGSVPLGANQQCTFHDLRRTRPASYRSHEHDGSRI